MFQDLQKTNFEFIGPF